jgi:hypothetical protein
MVHLPNVMAAFRLTDEMMDWLELIVRSVADSLCRGATAQKIADANQRVRGNLYHIKQGFLVLYIR